MRFTIRRLMAVVAFAAIALGAPHYPPRVFVALGCAGLVMAVLCVARAPKKAPTIEFLCALIGIVLGFVFMPAQQNGYAYNDFRDLFSVIEGCAVGAVVGTVIAWADRRISRFGAGDKARGESESSSVPPTLAPRQPTD